MNVIGINSSGFHESSVCLLQDGQIAFACAEERLTRLKQDSRFPKNAIAAALDFSGLRAEDIDHVAFSFPSHWRARAHDVKLMLSRKFPANAMTLERFGAGVIRGARHRGGITDYLREFSGPRVGFHSINHHLAHALSSYGVSGFDDAAILVVDGRGSHEATTIWDAKAEQLTLKETIEFPNSLGVFYAGLTEVLGFAPFADEWKVMGLAAFGHSTFDLSPLLQVTADSYLVEGRRFFGKYDGDRSGVEAVVGPRRRADESLSERHQNLARATQDACEQAMLALLRRTKRLTGRRKICLAGGVALNCKANGELLRSGLIDEIFVPPAAGDDGTCVGAALAVYQKLGIVVPRNSTCDAYLGQEFSNPEIEHTLRVFKLPYRHVSDPSIEAGDRLAANEIVGWFQGRMEFGARALGNRSILANPRLRENTDRVNDAVKFRENWRPFAPSVLAEFASKYFDGCDKSPFMTLSYWARAERALEIPAVVHVDGSSRVQTVERTANPRYYKLIEHFHRLTGTPVVMNTSFNLKGDAIVCTPKDAIQTFYSSGLDALVIGDFVVQKASFERRAK